jgi:Na+/phosphate symporter
MALSTRDVLGHPVTAVTAVLAAAAQLLNLVWLDAAVAVLLANIGTLFTAVSITGFTIVPEIEALPNAPFRVLALVIGVIYVAYLLEQLADQLQSRL